MSAPSTSMDGFLTASSSIAGIRSFLPANQRRKSTTQTNGGYIKKKKKKKSTLDDVCGLELCAELRVHVLLDARAQRVRRLVEDSELAGGLAIQDGATHLGRDLAVSRGRISRNAHTLIFCGAVSSM
jgi:hypothetical protein